MYYVQVQSVAGGFLSTAAKVKKRENVGGFAEEQAAIFTKWPEARHAYFSDATLTVKLENKICSLYRWYPEAGEWRHGWGTKITALEGTAG